MEPQTANKTFRHMNSLPSASLHCREMGFMTQLPKLLASASASAPPGAAENDGAASSQNSASAPPQPSPPGSETADPTTASAAMVVAAQIKGGLSSFLPPAPLPRQKALNLLCVIEAVLLLVGGQGA